MARETRAHMEERRPHETVHALVKQETPSWNRTKKIKLKKIKLIFKTVNYSAMLLTNMVMHRQSCAVSIKKKFKQVRYMCT